MDPCDVSALTDRQAHRVAIVERLLTSLDDVVWRYRTFSSRVELTELCAEAVTAEVAHHLALARVLLTRHPAIGPTSSSPELEKSGKRPDATPRTPTPRGPRASPIPSRAAMLACPAGRQPLSEPAVRPIPGETTR